MYKKKYLETDVYEATQERLKFIFDNFDNVLISFSGGKDSGICLNLCYDYAVKTNQTDKLAMYHLDYESQYTETTNYVTKCFLEFPKILRKFWLCLPVSVPCAVSVYDNYWIPWEKSKKDIWAREMPEFDCVIHEDNVPFKFSAGIADYDLQDDFGEWFSDKYGKTAVIIGIRTDESLNRFRAIVSDRKTQIVYGKQYLVGTEKLAKSYPIYDWCVEDIFTAYAKFGYSYNKLYDLFYQAGVPYHLMRVASPFLSQGLNNLKLYRVIEPSMWCKLLGRVDGVNFAGLYGGTTAMGWKSIVLPKGHTWKSYRDFLLSTLPENTRNIYLQRFSVSENFWLTKGGVLSEKTIEELKKLGVKIEIGEKTNYKTTKLPVKFLEYPDDLDVSEFSTVPSYKRMCVCIMKNDFLCKYMGFTLTKTEQERRKAILEKYESMKVKNV